jgi:hypothetical protein
MSILGKLKAKFRNVKHVSRKAEEQTMDELWLKSYARLITPSRLEVMDTHLLLDQRTFVRCLIAGLPKSSGGEGYPRDMTSKTIERIQELSFEGCKIMLSHGLIQVPGDKAKDNLQQASYTVNKEQKHKQQNGTGTDLELMCKSEDIVSNYRQIYFNSQRSFHSSFIIVMMGKEKEVFTAESYIISILKSESIDVQIPAGRHLEMFLSALPFPSSDSKAWVEVRSDTAAVLCTSTNLNSRTDEKGLYFGKDLKTNNEILIDLNTLPARHFTFLGATGSGKTYSLMLLLMRMHDMLNNRIIYVTPKADHDTNYKAVARYYGDKACVVDIGDTGANINPLQILIDKQSMGSSSFAYSKAYDRHKDLLVRATRIWLPSLSENADSYLDETLNIVYEQAGIIRERPETWDNPWPIMQNLYDIWDRDAANSDLGTKQKTAEALKNKTYQITGKGMLSYMNRPTTELDLSKDFIVIDMSNVPSVIKDFMSILVTGMLHSRFSPDNERDTIIAIDEAGVYLRDPEQSKDMLKTLMQGRSHGVYLGLCTHQPSDFTKNGMREEFQTNMFCNIILGANIKNAIDDVGKYFGLSEDEKNTLLECGDDEGATPGQGLLIVKGQKIPIRFEASELEHEVIKGKYIIEKESTGFEFMILPEYQSLVDDQRIIFPGWCKGDISTLLTQGYERHKVARIEESGTTTVYVPAGMVQDELIKSPHVGKQTLDHYASVVQLAGFLSVNGFEEISITHNKGANISAKIGGVRVAFEYEKHGNESPNSWMKKKESALENHDIVKFVCNSTDAKQIVKVVGEKYILRRGTEVSDFIKTMTGNLLIKENKIAMGENEQIGAL